MKQWSHQTLVILARTRVCARVMSVYITWSNGDSGMETNLGECISWHVQRLVQVLLVLDSLESNCFSSWAHSEALGLVGEPEQNLI